jgi:hypothetical protein
VVVICPKYKTRLKVDEGKLTVEGSRFKCPKCSTFLLIKKPEEKVEKPLKEPLMEKPEQKVEIQTKPEVITEKPLFDEKVERAKRLARTIISDIYLYNSAKADEAIRNNSFYSAFAAEIKEGVKLYESRIAQEVQAQGDFFKEAIENFIEGKKKVL